MVKDEKYECTYRFVPNIQNTHTHYLFNSKYKNALKKKKIK